MSTDEQTGKDLLAAACLLETNEWARGFYAKGNEYCLMGAVREVVRGDEEREAEAAHALHEQLRRRGSSLGPIGWNDHICESKEEAVALLRATALGR